MFLPSQQSHNSEGMQVTEFALSKAHVPLFYHNIDNQFQGKAAPLNFIIRREINALNFNRVQLVNSM